MVPVDGSAISASVLPLALDYATAVGGRVEVVSSIDASGNRDAAARRIHMAMAEVDEPPVEIRARELVAESPGMAISDFIAESPEAIVMMSSHGYGRSAAVLGSVTDDVLRRAGRPVLVVGPKVDRDHASLGGEYVVGVDGSARAETVLPLAAAWAAEFGAVPRLVEAVDRDAEHGDDPESWYCERLATELRERTGARFESEVVRGSRLSDAVIEFAAARSASLIFATTHGRTGLQRLRSGSVAAGIVRNAPCPVVLYHPPETAA